MTAVKAPEFLRWDMRELRPGASVVVDWQATEEGLLQVIAGTGRVSRAADTHGIEPGTAVWVSGAGAVELSSDVGGRVLDVRVRGESAHRARMTPVIWDALELERLNESLAGRSVAGPTLSAWRYDVMAGYRVDDLSHREEQISVPLGGEFTMLVDGAAEPLARGGVAFVPTSLRHGGDFSSGAVCLLEVFSPPRRFATTLEIA
jgi:quercetin dioxygenase-like cupin family protein